MAVWLQVGKGNTGLSAKKPLGHWQTQAVGGGLLKDRRLVLLGGEVTVNGKALQILWTHVKDILGRMLKRRNGYFRSVHFGLLKKRCVAQRGRPRAHLLSIPFCDEDISTYEPDLCQPQRI